MQTAAIWAAASRSVLGMGKHGLLTFRDTCEGGFDDVQTLAELLVGHDERDENADNVVERACGDEDQAVLVAIFSDFFGLGVGRLTSFSVANQFDGAHSAEAADVADKG